MDIISGCITKGLMKKAEELAIDVLSEISEKINPAIVGITLPIGQHQDYFDDVRLLTSLAICVADHPGLKHIYEKCIHGGDNFPGALTRMNVIGGDSLQIEWIDIFRALGKVSDYERMLPLYEKLRSKLTGEERDMLDGKYAVVIMQHDPEKAVQIILSITDLGDQASSLSAYIYQLFEEKADLTGWQEWVRKLKDIEELIDPDAVDFTTLNLGGSDTEPVLTPLSAGDIGILENDSYQLSDDSDESIYIQKQLKKLLPNLALLAIQKGDTPSFEELLNQPDMANDYAVEVSLRVADHLYHKAEIKYFY